MSMLKLAIEYKKELIAISELIHYPNDWDVKEFPTLISALEYLLESYLNNCTFIEEKDNISKELIESLFVKSNIVQGAPDKCYMIEFDQVENSLKQEGKSNFAKIKGPTK